MPRIAATVLSFVLIAFSIGFNMVRYPVVWEMVGPPSGSALSEDPSQPDDSADEPADDHAAAEASPAEQSSDPLPGFQAWADSGGEDALEGPAPREPDRYTPAWPSRGEFDLAGWPAADPDAASGHHASPVPDSPDRPDGLPSSLASASPQVGPLVPVVYPSEGDAAGRQEAPTPQVQRLPPVDRIAPPAVDAGNFALPVAPIPIYPSTGVE